MKKTAFALITFVYLLAGCSYIPLTTMVKMSGFDEEDFRQIEPADIRAKITTNTTASFVEEKMQLNFKFITRETKVDKTLPLKIVTESTHTESSWFGDDEIEHTTIFKLDDSAIEMFKELQQLPMLKNRPEDSKFSFAVRWGLDAKSEDLKRYTISTDLLFNPKDGYFTLIEDLEIDTSKEEQDL